jgi:hypothetical protein
MKNVLKALSYGLTVSGFVAMMVFIPMPWAAIVCCGIISTCAAYLFLTAT